MPIRSRIARAAQSSRSSLRSIAPDQPRRALVAEAMGTGFLVIALVGSGIVGASLAGGIAALAVLFTVVAVACVLYALITVFGPLSGGHFNPAVTAAFVLRGDMAKRTGLAYVIAQVLGACAGVILAHLMFGLPPVQMSSSLPAPGLPRFGAELVVSFGLLMVIFGGLAARAESVPALVSLYVPATYLVTAEPNLANPAVTLARGLSGSTVGLWPGYVVMFLVAQVVAVGLATVILPRLFRD